MTWTEKVALLSGIDGWQTSEISRLGIGSLKTTDGPVGARGNQIVDGPRALFLPATVLLASTWSKSDLREIGRVLSREAKTKRSQILLAPTVCCARNPLGGRNFESFSEDPFLSGTLAIDYVSGVQESGEVVATAKHFVANDQEYQRFSINVNVEQKALREIYLRPFEMLVKSSSPPGCFMTAYNRVNGEHMDSNKTLVNDILRKEWGYQGLVMSDWGGTNSTVESVLAGCDLEMPGPSELRGEKLTKALNSKKHPGLEPAVDASCRRLLTLVKRLNLLGLNEADAKATRLQEEYTSTNDEDITTVRRITAEGAVLLKNSERTLPLKPVELAGKKVAFIGSKSKMCTPGGGGSASMNPQYLSQPIEAFKTLTASLGVSVEVNYCSGMYSNKWLPLISSEQWRLMPHMITNPTDSGAMLRLEFFSTTNLTGPIQATQFRTSSYVDLFDTAPTDMLGKPYSFRLTSTVTPSRSGMHSFSVSSVGSARLYLDRELILDNNNWEEKGETFYAFGSAEVIRAVDMQAAKTYEITVECATRQHMTEASVQAKEAEVDPLHVFASQAGLRLGFLEQLPPTLETDAIALSNASDYTVVILGLDDEWESEGYDRGSLSLPASQDSLVRSLIKQSRCPESIVFVNQSGTPVEMPWASDSRIATILQIWYGGQEAGNALADILLGIATPSGRLPVTWPKRYQDLHFADRRELWPGVDGQVWYEEGTSVGYRWYLKNQIEPQWWFGFGLSYTEFEVRDLAVAQLPGEEHGWELSVTVKNIGEYPSDEVVQVYMSPAEDPSARKLVAYGKTPTLAPAKEITVTLIVNARDAANWISGSWELEAVSTVVKTLSSNRTITLALLCPPYLIARFLTIAVSSSSDRFNERICHITISKIVATVGFIAAFTILNLAGRHMAKVIFTIGTCGVNSLVLGWCASVCGQTKENKAATVFIVITIMVSSFI
ncbi:glycoside hydrolase family 3 protein [Dothidotthia symphoricarpi CBS 119687]|uniref:beta-glucosidase n=1 Tax=Dothidotthia symphoricarpi CBS 119687 TaxID=1392245 RepID=A0A6A6ATR1_9PLEO|nr:glycoside hydrolase family 3 protein [Dothidotthia symphoricarpi CBS 119687]KAF2134345.1 glycoside hydrolase family 3 protein [Dothidotthia symphoricarpi CBS 119687]